LTVKFPTGRMELSGLNVTSEGNRLRRGGQPQGIAPTSCPKPR